MTRPVESDWHCVNVASQSAASSELQQWTSSRKTMSAVSGVANRSKRLTMAAGRSSWIALVTVNGRSPSPLLSSSRQSA